MTTTVFLALILFAVLAIGAASALAGAVLIVLPPPDWVLPAPRWRPIGALLAALGLIVFMLGSSCTARLIV